MQRELADDAPWKRIQQNTFTRWANEHLKLVNRHIEDLQSDLSDGLSLIALIEVLSQKKVPRYNKRPNFRSQKLENVSVVLDFLENTERIRLVNIGKFILTIGYFDNRKKCSEEISLRAIEMYFRQVYSDFSCPTLLLFRKSLRRILFNFIKQYLVRKENVSDFRRGYHYYIPRADAVKRMFQ